GRGGRGRLRAPVVDGRSIGGGVAGTDAVGGAHRHGWPTRLGGRTSVVTFRRWTVRDDTEDVGVAVGRSERDVVTVLAEMLMLPLTALLYGMELLVRAMQGTHVVTGGSMRVTA